MGTVVQLIHLINLSFLSRVGVSPFFFVSYDHAAIAYSNSLHVNAMKKSKRRKSRVEIPSLMATSAKGDNGRDTRRDETTTQGSL